MESALPMEDVLKKDTTQGESETFLETENAIEQPAMVTPAEYEIPEEYEYKPSYDYVDLFKASYSTYTPEGVAYTAAVKGEIEAINKPDPGFKIKNNKELLEGLDETGQMYVIKNSLSYNEALQRRDEALAFKKDQEVFAQHNIAENLTAAAVAILGSPSTYIAGYGQAKAIASMAKAGYTSTKAGLTTGAAFGAAYEVPAVVVNPYEDSTNLIWGAAFGMTFDGLLGKFQDRARDNLHPVNRSGQQNYAGDEDLSLNIFSGDDKDTLTVFHSAGKNYINIDGVEKKYDEIELNAFSSPIKKQGLNKESDPSSLASVGKTTVQKRIVTTSSNVLSGYSKKTNSFMSTLNTSFNKQLKSLNLPEISGVFATRSKRTYGSYSPNSNHIELSKITLDKVEAYNLDPRNQAKRFEAVKALETAVHELGHAIRFAAGKEIADGNKSSSWHNLTRAAYEDYLKTKPAVSDNFRQPASKKQLTDINAKDKKYYQGYEEWFADSIAKYLMSDGKILENNFPKTLADKYLRMVKKIYKELLSNFGFTNKDYDERIKDFLEGFAKNLKDPFQIRNQVPMSHLPDAAIDKINSSLKDKKYRLEKNNALVETITSQKGYRVTKDVFQRGGIGEGRELTDGLISQINKERDSEALPETPYQRQIAKLARALDFSFGKVSQKLKSSNMYMKYVANEIISDASGINNKGMTSAQLSAGYTAHFSTGLVGYTDMHYKKWASRNHKITRASAEAFSKKRKEFDKELFNFLETVYRKEEELSPVEFAEWRQALRDNNELDVSVLNAADDIDAMMKHIHTEARKRGVQGFEDFDSHAGYMPHILDQDKVANINSTTAKIYQKLMARQLERLLDVDNNKSLSIAKNILNNALDRGLGFQSDIAHILTKGDASEIKDLMKGVPTEDIDYILNKITSKSKQSSSSSRTKRRIKFDLSESMVVDGKAYSLSDIYSTNLSMNMARYSMEMAGHISLARKGFKSRSDWDNFTERAVRSHQMDGSPDYTPEQVKNNLEDMYSLLLSRPVKNSMNKGVRRFNEFVNLILFGKSGIPQIAEYGVAAGNLGLTNMLKGSSEFKSLLRDVKTGKVDNKLLAQIETFGFVGEDQRLMPPNIDRIGEATDTGNSKLGAATDDILAKANRTLWHINLNNSVKAMEQRAVTIVAIQDTLDKVKNFDKISESKKRRLLSVGIGKKEIEAIKRNLDKVEFTQHNGIKNINLEKWNQDDAQDFAFMIRNAVNTYIQHPLPTETLPLMHSSVGAILLKARQYPIIALQKQLMRNLYHGDLQSLAYFMYSGMFGGLAYTGMVTANCVGKDDMGKCMEEKLGDWKDITAGAAMYTSFTSLSPDAMNGAAALGVMDRRYSPSGIAMEQSGYNSSFSPRELANSVPGINTFINMTNASTLGMRWVINGDVPDDAYRTIKGTTPFSNTFFLNPLFNQMKENLED